jgi:hypothetical protein
LELWQMSSSPCRSVVRTHAFPQANEDFADPVLFLYSSFGSRGSPLSSYPAEKISLDLAAENYSDRWSKEDQPHMYIWSLRQSAHFSMVIEYSRQRPCYFLVCLGFKVFSGNVAGKQFESRNCRRTVLRVIMPICVYTEPLPSPILRDFSAESQE